MSQTDGHEGPNVLQLPDSQPGHTIIVPIPVDDIRAIVNEVGRVREVLCAPGATISAADLEEILMKMAVFGYIHCARRREKRP